MEISNPRLIHLQAKEKFNYDITYILKTIENNDNVINFDIKTISKKHGKMNYIIKTIYNKYNSIKIIEMSDNNCVLNYNNTYITITRKHKNGLIYFHIDL